MIAIMMSCCASILLEWHPETNLHIQAFGLSSSSHGEVLPFKSGKQHHKHHSCLRQVACDTGRTPIWFKRLLRNKIYGCQETAIACVWHFKGATVTDGVLGSACPGNPPKWQSKSESEVENAVLGQWLHWPPGVQKLLSLHGLSILQLNDHRRGVLLRCLVDFWSTPFLFFLTLDVRHWRDIMANCAINKAHSIFECLWPFILLNLHGRCLASLVAKSITRLIIEHSENSKDWHDLTFVLLSTCVNVRCNLKT